METVYKITNVINKKVYIGKTKKRFSRRRGNHLSDLRNNRHVNRRLQFEFNAYNENSFKFEVLETSESNLDLLEKAYISLYLSKDEKYGYNLADGGFGNHGWKATDETRMKMSKSKKGLLSGSRHPQFGKKMSEKVKLLLKEANIKKYESRPKVPVIAINKKTKEQVKFNSIKEASLFLNAYLGNVKDVIDKETRSCKGWRIKREDL